MDIQTIQFVFEQIKFLLGALCGTICGYLTLCYVIKKLEERQKNNEQN